MFGDKILILGGRINWDCSTNNASVLLYDITKNKCKELAALPYKVLLYNIKTQKSRMLPDMKYKRDGCVAAVVRDTVIVMGGMDERGKCLKSVECFRFDRYSWQELPEMQEARHWATAVVC
jgi:homoserine kinase